MKKGKEKVLVAMSGGVDSSVAAALLVRDGYDVTGAFMVNYDEEQGERQKSDDKFSLQAIAQSATACWVPDYRDALRVSAKLGIPLLKFDFTKEYKELVLDYMFKEYEAGRTPNPDVLCNKFIKFGVWLEKARELGFDFLATGHYARVERTLIPTFPRGGKESLPPLPVGEGRVRGGLHLLQSKDDNKDQTYFLHQLNQEQLSRVIFPIGDYTKDEVRKLARKFDLPTAEKEESMGICFIGEVPMKEFLQTKIKKKSGKIVLSNGTVVGGHDGLAFYTIGERIGVTRPHSLSLSLRREKATLSPGRGAGGEGLSGTSVDTRPLYVVAKHLDTNELVVGREDDPLLYKKEIEVGEVNWIGQSPKFPLKCEVRLRHRQPLQRATIAPSPRGRGTEGEGSLAVTFNTPQRAVTPGQFAVFYLKGECLGGGVIN